MRHSGLRQLTKALKKPCERPFSISFGDLPRREVHQSRRSLPPEPSSRHVKSGDAKTEPRAVCTGGQHAVRPQKFAFAELSFLGYPDPLMSRRASTPSSTFFLPHQTKPKELP